MMRTIVLLLVFPALQAGAVSLWTQLTTTNIQDTHRLAFTVKAEPTQNGRRFQVTIAPRQGELSPFLEPRLSVSDDGSEIASCLVAGARRGKAVQYEFTVAEKYLAKSKFTFGNMAHDAQGRRMPAGDFYWFYLGDFAAVVPK